MTKKLRHCRQRNAVQDGLRGEVVAVKNAGVIETGAISDAPPGVLKVAAHAGADQRFPNLAPQPGD